MSLESGTKLAHYEILEPIGKGEDNITVDV